MRLKEFQQDTLEAFEDWLKELNKQEARSLRRVKAGDADEEDRDFPAKTWRILSQSGSLPKAKNSHGELITPTYNARIDAQNRPVPNVCLKIPTGGGKTLLGAAALQRLGPRHGIVLWITPSKAIFTQTWLNFATRLHPYRQTLERACGGRVKLLKKGDSFSRGDVDNYLCVMPLMLQAADRTNGRDFLKIFRDSGKYEGFFPSADNRQNAADLLAAHPDLDIGDLAEGGDVGMVKSSLFNVLKMTRPIIVLDEAHNSYSAGRRKMLSTLNPRLVLELSATPDIAVSNILVNVKGAAMRREEMIKLPINLHGIINTDWQTTLAKAVDKLQRLQQCADTLNENTGKYIRPIMLIRVERVGKDQRDGMHIHAEDVRRYLTTHLGVPPDHIRQKTAEKDEIAKENLLSPYSSVRYILTKDALREGWDCPFAYVLTLLDTTQSQRALTQMIGRVLRQPDTQSTGERELDECYVYCGNAEVSQAAQKIKEGLEQEGLEDIASHAVVGGENNTGPGALSKKIPYLRRDKWRQTRFFLPQVLHRRGKRQYRPLMYESDILPMINWPKIARAAPDIKNPSKQDVQEIIQRLDLSEMDDADRQPQVYSLATGTDWTLEYFVRRLGDVIPNPFLAAEIVIKTLARIKSGKLGDDDIYKCRADLSERMRSKCAELLEHESRRVFCQKIKDGDIRFDLVAGAKFELPDEITKMVEENPQRLTRRYGDPLQKSLFTEQGIFAKEFNGLERDFALHLDGHEAVAWWHRLAVGSYGLQGWRRGRMYPDFVVCVGKGQGTQRRVLVLETKGLHLAGNADTVYKENLLSTLEAAKPHAQECGVLELPGNDKKYRMKLRILLEDSWQREFAHLAADSG
ncbi:MAG: DEAD/DEAH box helicase [Gammaproteobacteria bacterium]